jgi:serine/threonine protein kinase
MGVIYQAEDPEIGRTVAIKLVRTDLLDGEDREEFLTRFRHEARAAGRCMHPNIVAIYDFAMHDGNPFIAMEFIDGVPLGQALKGAGRFAPSEAVAIVVQMLEALQVAHSLGIVHRDVKPANVLLLRNGQVKMTDFGISRMDTSHITQEGAVIGTPAYMSPEQCRGEAVDARSDLFSVGTVLYELLTGTRAFSGRNATEVTLQVLSAQPRDLAEIVEVPASLASALARSMAKSRDMRFASAREMADALQTALRAGAESGASDQTVMLPRSAFDHAIVTRPAIDDATLDTIERRLARHVGPIARHLVRDAAKRSDSLEALCETVARNIGQPADRQKFMTDSLAGTLTHAGTGSVRTTAIHATGAQTSATASKIPADQIERAERALTKALGPIAKVLVKRALPGATSEAALWEHLATHIQRAPDRDVFLRSRGGR